MASMKEALANAFAEATADEEVTEDTAVEAEVTEADEPVTQEDETADSQEEQAAEEETPAADEVPVEYFGVNLSDLPPEARAEVIAGYQERDKFIQQLLRDKSDSPDGAETPAAEALAAETESVSDTDLLAALGIDPENDPFAEATAKVALPLAKMVLQLNEQVSALSQKSELDATERYWSTSLTALESQYGKLPVQHDDVLKTAAENGISEPMDAYWRIMGPLRQGVMSEVEKRRADLAKLKQDTKGTSRPSSQADTSEKLIDAKNVKDAMQQAYTQLAKERGLS